MMKLLLFFFAGSVDGLGHPDYVVRERAERELRRGLPFSLPSVWVAVSSPDREVQVRAARVVPVEWRAGWAATCCVVHEGAKDQPLPWGEYRYVAGWMKAEPSLRKGLKLFADAHGLVQSWELMDYEVCQCYDYPGGLDHLRFRFRKIPTAWRAYWDQQTLSAMREEWDTIQRGK